MRYLLIVLTLFAMLFVAGCGEPKIKAEVSHGEGEAVEGETVEGETTSETHAEGEATTGETTTAPSLAKALTTAGATVEEGEAVTQPFFAVEGHILKVNGQDVQVFEFADAAAAEAQVASVVPDGTAVGTTPVSVEGTPHFFYKDNTIALYVGEDAAVLAALEVVFGAQFAGGAAE